MSAKNLASVIKCQKGVKINSVTCRAQLCQKPRTGLTLALTGPSDTQCRNRADTSNYGTNRVESILQLTSREQQHEKPTWK